MSAPGRAWSRGEVLGPGGLPGPGRGRLVPEGCFGDGVPGPWGDAWSGAVPGPREVPGSRRGWYPSMHCGRPPRRDGYCCGRYASYWNAFLFLLYFRN